MRVFALSDIHFDYEVNAKWIRQLSTTEFTDDLLILAGDVSDSANNIIECLVQLVRRFRKVLYIPGNHELWVIRNGTTGDSFSKFCEVLRLANACGASTEPFHIGGLSIVPLYSWYDYSFGTPSARLRDIWMDFYACRWPSELSDREITKTFLLKNEPRLEISNDMVISFSHFLPRIDLMPSFIPSEHKILYPVLGAASIDRQIRQLGAKIHVYGHSHVNRHISIEGITYINNAFGYPRETRISAKSLRCIYDRGDPDAT